ncbi:MAG: host attachment protein [Thermosynechococcaceae cyanobacterium]
MSQCLVIVVNKTKARFLSLKEPEPLEQGDAHLVEQQELLNPIQSQMGRELWANPKSGGNRAGTFQVHGYDDHRQKHLDEFDRRFAQAIGDEINSSIHLSQNHRVLLVAESQVLGYLRQALDLPKTVAVRELAKDLGKLPPQEIYSYLLNKQILPWRVKQVS